jgi:exodeoxyribonuclease VIII
MDFLKTISNDDYHVGPGLSRSDLMAFIKGPNYFKHYRKDKKSSRAMATGSAFHSMLLEPEEFRKDYVVAPDGINFATKAGKEFKELHNTKTVMKGQEYDRLNEMAIAVQTHPVVTPLLDGLKEKAMWFKFNDVELKTKPDLITIKDKVYIVDFKTTRDLSERKMKYSIRDHGYDIQLAMVSMGLMHHGISLPMVPLIVWVENQAPYDVVVTKLRNENIMDAGLRIQLALDGYKHCLSRDEWPSKYHADIIELDVAMIETDVKMNEDEDNATYETIG